MTNINSLPPERYGDLTDEGWVAFGRHVDSRYQRGMMVDGRPITNIEMCALTRFYEHERQQRVRRDGCCCDEGPEKDGHCRNGPGRCALVTKADLIAWKDKHGI